MGGIVCKRSQSSESKPGIEAEKQLRARERLSISVDVSSFLTTHKVGGDYACVLRHETRVISSSEAVCLTVTQSWPGSFTTHQSIKYAPARRLVRHPSSVVRFLCGPRKEAWEAGRRQRAAGGAQVSTH